MSDGRHCIDSLIRPTVDAAPFRPQLSRLHTLFSVYAATSPAPLPAPGLVITEEIRCQCERYLPMAGITGLFTRFYSAALTYAPLLPSSPFHNPLSWADCLASLPPCFQKHANPARLLEHLLDDSEQRLLFLFASFLPDRFYGPAIRYPRQHEFISERVKGRNGGIRCLDAACGIGDYVYALAGTLAAGGYAPEQIQVEGWTIEPLEIWAASHRSVPHDRERELQLQKAAGALDPQVCGERIRFRRRDIIAAPEAGDGSFDLIVCNGLLGGPIIHDTPALQRSIGNLGRLLAPGGVLAAANHFHGGWQKKCPQGDLWALFKANGLDVRLCGEGIAGLKPDQ